MEVDWQFAVTIGQFCGPPEKSSPRVRVCPGMNFHIWCVVVTNMSVCLFVCQQVACDVVTVYSRSESPCHVSLSQSNRYRSFTRPADRSVTITRSISRSIYLCLSVPVQRNNTRPRALTFAVRSSALSISSLSSSHLFDLSRAHITCLRKSRYMSAIAPKGSRR